MGYDLDYENDFEIPEAKSIDTLLEESTLARKENINEGVHYEDDFKRTLSPAESNESDIYSEDPVDSVELEERAAEAVVTDTAPSEELKAESGPSLEEQHENNDTTESLSSPVDQKLLEVDFSFPPVHSYNLFSKKQVGFITKIKQIMSKKFPNYNDFVNCINCYNPELSMDSRCFLFYHLIYTLDNPIDFIYLLDFDPFNSSPLMASPCLEIIDFWKYIKTI
jgi:hypothetical protein